ncbi:MAG: SusD/RagB family nutrient-binding outer membrane lipoprotein [Candidatus Azobacteroides sp.]|nr:SusD/RagB family nutrient-binding outer membrane lipoprotein [Candidatus Azobacteroides sp.]
MKKYSFLLGLSFVLFSFFIVSCTEDKMDKINEDKNHPQDVDAKFIVTEILTSTAFNVVGADLSFYASMYIEHEVGVFGQMYSAEIRNVSPSSSSTYNNQWNAAYTNIQNAKIVISKCSEGGSETEKKSTLGVAQIMLAYNAAVLTDLFGDTPFSEAGDLNLTKQPKLDKQEDIYKDVMSYLDEAISNLQGADNTLGNQDVIYKGSSNSWIKAAYALKARYTMRLLYRSANRTQDLNNILTYISKSFASPDEELKYNLYDGANASNPYFSLYADRDYLGASQSFLNKLVSRNDPRAAELYMIPDWEQITDPAEINAAPNGNPIELQDHYDMSVIVGAQTAPTHLISYHELKFIEAEALCRLNRISDAEVALKEAITAAFANLANSIHAAVNSPLLLNYGGIEAETTLDDPQVAEDYFDDSVKPLFDANPLRETMIQKYLGLYGANGEVLEVYNDYRRLQALGEASFIQLDNPLNSTKFPLRYSYGTSDVSANLNVKEAYGDKGQYVYTEKVWWAGGTR